MANIKTHLNNIKGALYGKDVRESIHDGIDAINKEVENTTGRQIDLENTFDQLVISAGNSNAEIVDARVKSNGTSYSKLGDRLDAVDSQLAHNENDLALLKNVNYVCSGNINDFFENIEDNSYITIPYNVNGWEITSPINVKNKRLTIEIQGDIYDKITKLPTPSTNIDINGRGLFAFDGCEVSIIQRPGTVIDGGKTTSGLSSSPRNIFYFYNCGKITTDGLNTQNTTLHPVASVNCTNITEVNGVHRNCESIIHTSCDYVKLNNITVFDAVLNGITVQNRGLISEGNGFVLKRPKFVNISNCRVYGVTSSNNYAVGITIDSCDYITCNDNIVDLKNKGTMAYSFADSKVGSVSGNIALNCWNSTNGSYKYCGVGMECERIEDISFSNNIFTDCLIGYLINNSKNVSVDGKYNITDMEQTTPSGMTSGNSAYVNLVGSTRANTNIKISGIVDNTSSSVQIGGIQNTIYINNLVCSNYKGRNISIYGTIDKLVVTDCDFNAYSGDSGDIFNIGQNKVANLYIENVKAKHHNVKYFINGYNTKGNLYMKNLYIDGFDKVCNFASTWNNIYMQFLDCFNVNSTNESSGTNSYYMTDIRVNGKLQNERGLSKTVWANKAPVSGTDKGYRGQKWIDATNKKEYTYMDGWVQLN